ncbi:MAG: MetQ/NlpA family ABC transporter substrate-binding protein, partial [Clostridium sp.]
MKKKLIISSLLTGVLALGLIGCGSKSADDKTIKIGVSPVPHQEIVENIVPQLEKEGYKVEIVPFTDYVLPNEALASGEIDANYFQHIAYLNDTNEKKNLDLAYTEAIHLEPIALYSKNVKNLKDLADGATIAIPNDASNGARALKLLEKEG